MKMNADVSLMINLHTSCPHHAIQADVFFDNLNYDHAIFLYMSSSRADMRGINL